MRIIGGAHHKQEILDEILRDLVGEVRYNELQAEYEWET